MSNCLGWVRVHRHSQNQGDRCMEKLVWQKRSLKNLPGIEIPVNHRENPTCVLGKSWITYSSLGASRLKGINCEDVVIGRRQT